MEFNKIITITGKPGLFKVVSQSKNAIIAESLLTNKKMAINATQNVSLLDNIAIYTYSEEVPLFNVFNTIYEQTEGKETISHKESNKVLSNYFSEILPEYDEERVYPSNIKKVIQWYNILVKAGFDFTKTEDTSNENVEKE